MDDLAPKRARRLDAGLRTILAAGFSVEGDYVLLARHAPTAPAPRHSIFGDDVGYEGAVNHVHVEREVTTLRGRWNPGAHAVAYALALATQLESSFPETAFDVWATGGAEETWIVRFHRASAEGGGSWLGSVEDIDDAALVAEVRP